MNFVVPMSQCYVQLLRFFCAKQPPTCIHNSVVDTMAFTICWFHRNKGNDCWIMRTEALKCYDHWWFLSQNDCCITYFLSITGTVLTASSLSVDVNDGAYSKTMYTTMNFIIYVMCQLVIADSLTILNYYSTQSNPFSRLCPVWFSYFLYFGEK